MSLLLLICLAGGFILSSASEKPHYDVENAEQLFEQYILTHNKTYSTREEKLTRLEIFKKKLNEINEINSESNATFDINNFSDLSLEELKQYMGFVPCLGEDECMVVTDEDIITNEAPKTLDWVAKGVATAVKSQLNCSASWDFACFGNIEGQYFLKTKQLKSFSEQEFVDCSKRNGACDGEDMQKAIVDVKDLEGIELESDYPYTGKKGTCKYNKTKIVTKIAGCKYYSLQDENKLKEVLAKKGPLIIGINGIKVTDYKKGIMKKKECDFPHFGGHAVTLVGYGIEDGVDYWIIKNSWGPTFGENGYFRITSGKNTCGLLAYIASADL